LQLKHSTTPIYFYQFSYDEKLGLIEKYIGDSSIPGMNFIMLDTRRYIIIITTTTTTTTVSCHKFPFPWYFS
jgi:hypothetical protein